MRALIAQLYLDDLGYSTAIKNIRADAVEV